jgi:hypothetical protein
MLCIIRPVTNCTAAALLDVAHAIKLWECLQHRISSLQQAHPAAAAALRGAAAAAALRGAAAAAAAATAAYLQMPWHLGPQQLRHPSWQAHHP